MQRAICFNLPGDCFLLLASFGILNGLSLTMRLNRNLHPRIKLVLSVRFHLKKQRNINDLLQLLYFINDNTEVILWRFHRCLQHNSYFSLKGMPDHFKKNFFFIKSTVFFLTGIRIWRRINRPQHRFRLLFSCTHVLLSLYI